jgi:hypothetical protein
LLVYSSHRCRQKSFPGIRIEILLLDWNSINTPNKFLRLILLIDKSMQPQPDTLKDDGLPCEVCQRDHLLVLLMNFWQKVYTMNIDGIKPKEYNVKCPCCIILNAAVPLMAAEIVALGKKR